MTGCAAPRHDGQDEPAPVKPRCYDCLSYDVAVKLIDPCGFEIWLCAEDWAAAQALHDKIMAMLEDATTALGDA